MWISAVTARRVNLDIMGNVIRCTEAVREYKHAASDRTYGLLTAYTKNITIFFIHFNAMYSLQPLLFIGHIFLRRFNTDFNYDKLTVKHFKIYNIL